GLLGVDLEQGGVLAPALLPRPRRHRAEAPRPPRTARLADRPRPLLPRGPQPYTLPHRRRGASPAPRVARGRLAEGAGRHAERLRSGCAVSVTVGRRCELRDEDRSGVASKGTTTRVEALLHRHERRPGRGVPRPALAPEEPLGVPERQGHG